MTEWRFQERERVRYRQGACGRHLFGLLGRIAMLVLGSGMLAAWAAPIEDIHVEYRHGQVFIAWDEPAQPPDGFAVDVFMADQPITSHTLPAASRIGVNIPAGSARNWWLDPAAFNNPNRLPDEPAPPAEGFRLDAGREPLEPASGLFVYTVTDTDPGMAWFAVVPVGGSVSNRVMAVTTDPLAVQPSIIQPIAWRGAAAGSVVPEAGVFRDMPVIISLHGRGGAASQATRERAAFMVFGTGEHGWRPGLPWLFDAVFGPDYVEFRPIDAMWVGRPVSESPDGRDRCPAISTWWFGCNEFIAEADRMAEGRVVNYTQRRLLYLVQWAIEHLGCDPDRIYIRGGSMGGSGTVAMALQHPDVFAAAYAQVPVVSHTHRTCRARQASSAWRLKGLAGPDMDTHRVANGTPLLTWMNGIHQLESRTAAEMPPLYVVNGRTDGSIPWCNNPDFYRALDATRRGYIAAWNNQGHGVAQRSVPEDLQDAVAFLFRFRRNASYPAFSNASFNEDPGNGDADDGDLVGYMNYGLSWSNVSDTPDRYSVVIAAGDRKGYPVTVDVTPRRRQHFRPSPGTQLTVTVGSDTQTLTVDEDGLFTICEVSLRDANPVTIEVVYTP